MREVLYKATIEVNKSDELLYFLLRMRYRPLHDSFCFHWVHLHLSFRNNEAEVFDEGYFEVAFVRVEVELVFAQDVENFPNDLAVFR
jgi:hypothetical protein